MHSVPHLDRVLRGLDPAIPYRVSLWPAVDDRLSQADEGIRGGDELIRLGLRLEEDRRETASRGDFWARLVVLEALALGPSLTS